VVCDISAGDGKIENLFLQCNPDLGGNKKVEPVLGGSGDADVCLHVEVVLRAHPEAAGHNSIGRRHGSLHVAVRHRSAHRHDVVGRIGRHRGRHVHVHRSLVRWRRLGNYHHQFRVFREIDYREL
jgi:hypothetical protein